MMLVPHGHPLWSVSRHWNSESLRVFYVFHSLMIYFVLGLPFEVLGVLENRKCRSRLVVVLVLVMLEVNRLNLRSLR